MQLKINGEQRTVADGITVLQLLEHLQILQGRVAVELNLEIIPRSRHAEQVLMDGDSLEIVHFVGGG